MCIWSAQHRQQFNTVFNTHLRTTTETFQVHTFFSLFSLLFFFSFILCSPSSTKRSRHSPVLQEDDKLFTKLVPFMQSQSALASPWMAEEMGWGGMNEAFYFANAPDLGLDLIFHYNTFFFFLNCAHFVAVPKLFFFFLRRTSKLRQIKQRTSTEILSRGLMRNLAFRSFIYIQTLCVTFAWKCGENHWLSFLDRVF